MKAYWKALGIVLLLVYFTLSSGRNFRSWVQGIQSEKAPQMELEERTSLGSGGNSGRSWVAAVQAVKEQQKALKMREENAPREKQAEMARQAVLAAQAAQKSQQEQARQAAQQQIEANRIAEKQRIANKNIPYKPSALENSIDIAQTSVWKVSNGRNFLYIGGTIHVLRESDYPIPEAFYIAFDGSEIIVFESEDDPTDELENDERIVLFNQLTNQFDVMIKKHKKVYDRLYDNTIFLTNDEDTIYNEMKNLMDTISEMCTDEQINAYLQTAQNRDIFNPDYQSLELILSNDAYKIFESLCKKYNYAVDELEFFKPNYAYTLLNAHIIIQFAKADGVEKIIYKKAIDYGKKIEYFETPDFQLNLLANLGSEYGNAYYDALFLDLWLCEDNQIEIEFDSLVHNWKNGIVDNEIMSYERKNFPLVYEAMIKNRNIAWIAKIEDYFKTSAIEFVLVGNDHLHGPDGILTRLREKGYTVSHL